MIIPNEVFSSFNMTKEAFPLETQHTEIKNNALAER